MKELRIQHRACPYRVLSCTLRGSESRTLRSVGVFRVVPAHELCDTFDRPLDPRQGELWRPSWLP